MMQTTKAQRQETIKKVNLVIGEIVPILKKAIDELLTNPVVYSESMVSWSNDVLHRLDTIQNTLRADSDGVFYDSYSIFIWRMNNFADQIRSLSSQIGAWEKKSYFFDKSDHLRIIDTFSTIVIELDLFKPMLEDSLTYGLFSKHLVSAYRELHEAINHIKARDEVNKENERKKQRKAREKESAGE